MYVRLHQSEFQSGMMLYGWENMTENTSPCTEVVLSLNSIRHEIATRKLQEQRT